VINQAFVGMAEKIINEQGAISLAQALEMAAAGSHETMDLIFLAGKIRQRFKQTQIFKCAIINAKSGMCPEDCAFCAQSAHHHTDVATYELLSAQKLEQTGLEVAAAGASNYSVVTSGTALTEADIETVCQVERR
jgi:biotin synthase